MTDSNAPRWASFMTDEEFQAFMSAVDAYFTKNGTTYTDEDGILTVDEELFGSSKLGLQNVAQVCKQHSAENYAAIVEDYFGCIRKAFEFNREFEKIADDYDQVSQYIGVRVYDDNYINHIGQEGIVAREFAPDLYMMLVFDLPDSIMNVHPEKLKIWDKAPEELFKLGIEQTRKKYPVQMNLQDFQEIKIFYSRNEHFYTANVLFDLADKPELVGKRGSLVAVPTRHAAIIYPINDNEVFQAINILYQVNYSICAEGPGSISENLYWYNEGEFTKLPVVVENQQLCFYPPENFVQVLESIRVEGTN